ncbi:MAG: hypothetical protein ACLFR7_12105, partial [Opitutales bacterium]
MITDNTTGAQWAVRAGPRAAWGKVRSEYATYDGERASSFFGRVQADVKIFNSQHIDWNPGAKSSVIFTTYQAASDMVSNFQAFADSVNAANNPYSPLGLNSNSFAHQAAAQLGIQRPTPQAWAPGSNLVLQ